MHELELGERLWKRWVRDDYLENGQVCVSSCLDC